MGAAMDGANQAMEDKKIKERYKEECDKINTYLPEMDDKRVLGIKRAMRIISRTSDARYDEDQNYIAIERNYMQLRILDEEGYPIVLVKSHSCREWAAHNKFLKDYDNPDNEIMIQSTMPSDIVDYLAYLAGYAYPGDARRIDNTLADMDAFERYWDYA